MEDKDDQARLAAANNADLYELIFSRHNLSFSRNKNMFVSLETPPPYYGSMLTLDPDAVGEQLAAVETIRSKRSGIFGLKDGFARLDLHAYGFRILFEGSWVCAGAGTFSDRVADGWHQIETSDDLADWEESWKLAGSPADRRVFPDGLLSESNIAFFGRRSADGYSSGCIANRSTNCVGLSNVFGVEARDVSNAAALTAAFSVGMPVVSYGGDTALRELRRSGFEEVGRLRIWLSNDRPG
jgi:hypothetical protein